MLFDLEKLESTLIAHWTEFVDVRLAIRFCQKAAEDSLSLQAPLKISELLMTRFDSALSDSNLVWFEYTVANAEYKVKVTTECTVDFEGSLKHVRTIEEFRQRQDV